jgi:hypothetical protein
VRQYIRILMNQIKKKYNEIVVSQEKLFLHPPDPGKPVQALKFVKSI